MDMKKFKENVIGIVLGSLSIIVIIFVGYVVLSNMKVVIEEGKEFCIDKEGIYESDVCEYLNCSNKEYPCVLNAIAKMNGDGIR